MARIPISWIATVQSLWPQQSAKWRNAQWQIVSDLNLRHAANSPRIMQAFGVDMSQTTDNCFDSAYQSATDSNAFPWWGPFYTDILLDSVLPYLARSFLIYISFLRKDISPQLIRWIQAWLDNRQSWVCFESPKSKKTILKQGVPQGSAMSPLLFLYYIDDLPWGSRDLHVDQMASKWQPTLTQEG